MKTGFGFKAVLLLLMLTIAFVMCASLADIKLKGNPEFVQSARLFNILHPIVNSTAGSQIISIEDAATSTVYKSELSWSSETEREGYIQNFRRRHGESVILDDFLTHSSVEPVNTSEMKKGDVAKIRDYNYHRIELSNPIDSLEYVILGQILFLREITKESSRSTFESTDIQFPVEFRIYEKGKDAGQAVIRDPFLTPGVALEVEVEIHDNTYHVEFQEQFNKRKVSVEKDSVLLAFFDLKPAAFVSTKMKGTVMVKPDLARDTVADVFTSYLVTVVMRGAMRRM